jgi:single-stranded-DNA-specific exonuclease
MGEGKHARFTLQSGGVHARAVAFGKGAKLEVEEGELVDATFVLEVNEWRGVTEPRLVLRHAQMASSPQIALPSEPIEPSPRSPAAPAQTVEGELVLF